MPFHDFDYKNIVPQDYAFLHDLDFRKVSTDKWFNDMIKIELGYTIPDTCRCGTETLKPDPDKILILEDYQKVLIRFLSGNTQQLFAWLFASIEWHDIIVKYVVFPERFKIIDMMQYSIDFQNNSVWVQHLKQLLKTILMKCMQ
jgi:hypothetical protein